MLLRNNIDNICIYIFSKTHKEQNLETNDPSWQ